MAKNPCLSLLLWFVGLLALPAAAAVPNEILVQAFFPWVSQGTLIPERIQSPSSIRWTYVHNGKAIALSDSNENISIFLNAELGPKITSSSQSAVVVRAILSLIGGGQYGLLNTHWLDLVESDELRRGRNWSAERYRGLTQTDPKWKLFGERCTLTFPVLTQERGVEIWQVRGDTSPFIIREVERTTFAPAGSIPQPTLTCAPSRKYILSRSKVTG